MPSAPAAKHVPSVRSHHGDEVSDPFEWLRQRDDPEVVAHLEAENRYAEESTAHLAPLREAIFEEIRSRIKETDLSVPVRYRDWWYYSRTLEGAQYAVHGRVPAVRDGAPVDRPALDGDGVPDGEVVLLDGNAEAQGHEFFSLGGLEVSVDGSLVAYSVDVEGDERFALRIRDVATGALVDEAVTDTGSGLAWSLDGRHVFYARVDEQWRQHQVWRHEVGSAAETDQLVFEEPDERFFVALGVSRDDRWILISAGSKVTSEVLLLDAGTPLEAPRVVAPRRPGVEYDVEPAGDRLLVVHNAGEPDFEVAQAPLDATSHEQWQPLLPPVAGERVLGVEAFEGFAAVSLRRDGLTALRILPRDTTGDKGFAAAGRDVDFDEPVYAVGTGSTPDYASPTLQLVYESMVTPSTVYDYDVATGDLTLLKRQEVPGYDLSRLEQRREWATAQDGTRIPISLVHKGVQPDGTAPGLIYGYGAYEISIDPHFSVARLSLLDRGFVYAVAHVRGGGEMGRRWYDDGKLEHKTNTFTDFVACAEHLVESGWVAPDRLVAEGGSAGGLLIGAATNLAPERFAAVHAQVPFVDALTTMLDPTLPLTVTEYDEWGDPLSDPAVYAYLKSYSPYENIGRTRYPAILATTSLNDTRVSYTEPAKWVARLRETVIGGDGDERPVLLRTEMTAGHGGRSGRYDAWREYAWELAFLIDRATRPASGAGPEAAAPLGSGERSMRRPAGDDGPPPAPIEPVRPVGAGGSLDPVAPLSVQLDREDPYREDPATVAPGELGRPAREAPPQP